jgi:hypothetical protein
MPGKRHNVPLNVYGGGRASFRTHAKHPVQGMFSDMKEDMDNPHIKNHVKSLGLKGHHVRQGFKHHPVTYQS